MTASGNTSRRALIVEDEPSIREIVRLHLSLAGFETDEAADGRAALDRLRADRFDLIVLDVMLPGVDGVTLCRALRSGGPNAGARRAHVDGSRHRAGKGPRPRKRRGRLPDQAVRRPRV